MAGRLNFCNLISYALKFIFADERHVRDGDRPHHFLFGAGYDDLTRVAERGDMIGGGPNVDCLSLFRRNTDGDDFVVFKVRRIDCLAVGRDINSMNFSTSIDRRKLLLRFYGNDVDCAGAIIGCVE